MRLINPTRYTRQTRHTKKFAKITTTPPMPFFNPIDDDDELVHRSDFHTLFIEEVPGEKMSVQDENGEYLEGIYSDADPFKIYKLYVGDFFEESNQLHPFFNTLEKAEPDDCLELHIDSNGGSSNEGKLFFNAINNFNKENVAAVLSSGYSMGALLFCMPDIRIVNEFSDLMFHDYSGVISGKAGDIESSHKHNSSHLRNFFKRLTLDKGFLSQEEFNLLTIGKEFWMDTEEMCKRGIATHVKTRIGTISADAYLESLKPIEPKVSKTSKPAKPAKAPKELMQVESIPERTPTKSPKSPRKKKEA
jgi:ATP-dependent protease ClpP protease subunit